MFDFQKQCLGLTDNSVGMASVLRDNKDRTNEPILSDVREQIENAKRKQDSIFDKPDTPKTIKLHYFKDSIKNAIK